MELHIKGEIDTAYFQERAIEVLEALSGEEAIDFTLVILENTDYCEAAADELVQREREAFIAQCQEMAVSSSFREGGNEYIIIKADKPFLMEQPAAARGLIAHEVMHMILRHRGKEQPIHETAKQYVGPLAERLAELGLEEKGAVSFAASVMQVSTLTVKDLIANTHLIEQGFYNDLARYYYYVLELDAYMPAPQFYSKEPTIAEVEKAVTFELYLMPSWLPFVVCDADQCTELVKQVHAQYERHISTTVSHMHEAESVYRQHYGEEEALVEAIYPVLVQSILDVITAQTDTDS